MTIHKSDLYERISFSFEGLRMIIKTIEYKCVLFFNPSQERKCHSLTFFLDDILLSSISLLKLKMIVQIDLNYI